mgnify:CR=1 FL=1
MSEILTLMSCEDRRAFSAMVGALAQKELGHSPALTHYMQSTGVLRSDADRVTSCENYGLEDDGADKDLARTGGEGSSKLEAVHGQIDHAGSEAESEMDSLGEALEKAKSNHEGVKVAAFAAALAVINTAVKFTQFLNRQRADNADRAATISELRGEKSKMWSELQNAKKAYATTHVSKEGLEQATAKYQTARQDLKNVIRWGKDAKMARPTGGKLAAGIVIGTAVSFAFYWLVTKVVIAAIRLAKKCISGKSAGEVSEGVGTEFLGFGKKKPVDEPKFHDRHTLMAATNLASECANDAVDVVHSVMSNLPKTAAEWQAKTPHLEKIQTKLDSVSLHDGADKAFAQTGWSGAEAARNHKAVQESFDTINKNDNWVRSVIDELPKHIHDEHTLASAKHFFHSVSVIYMDAMTVLYVALRELKRASDPARALVS